MKYYSTNNKNLQVSLKEAVLTGMPKDNGLFMPMKIKKFDDNFFDLVFTSGVLIHISPNDINIVLDEIYRCSRKYILGFETYSPEGHPMINYRGDNDLLWRTNFSKLFLESFPDLILVREKTFDYKPTGELDVIYLLAKK